MLISKCKSFLAGKLSGKSPAGGFSSEVFANDAVKFIEGAKTEENFFLYVAFMAPHDPRNPPEKYREMYYQNRPPLPKNFLPQHPFKIGPAVVFRGVMKVWRHGHGPRRLLATRFVSIMV
jgi:hypothetical protein